MVWSCAVFAKTQLQANSRYLSLKNTRSYRIIQYSSDRAQNPHVETRFIASSKINYLHQQLLTQAYRRIVSFPPRIIYAIREQHIIKLLKLKIVLRHPE